MSRVTLQTESRNEALRNLDALPTLEVARALASDQHRAVEAVLAAVDKVELAIEQIAARLFEGGRLHYVGAGTSGRLGVLDASEMPPTFGVDPGLVCAHIAGGEEALRRSVEGAEDDAHAGAVAMNEHVTSADAVIGISASGGARYVVAAIEEARDRGALTIAIVNNAGSPLGSVAALEVLLETGPEALTGSTRLKAGTAQKIALNTISTGVMVRLGKVYENLMVDLVASNEKLRARAHGLVSSVAATDGERAARLLEMAGGSVKVAIVMAARDVDAQSARELLDRERGFLRKLL